MSVGLMSTGIGRVPPEQTYLDISQGNRVSDVLYDRGLPPLRDLIFRAPRWDQIVERAESAPADLVPGLLASALLTRGIRSGALPSAGSAALLAVDRQGAQDPRIAPRVTVFGSGIGLVRKEAAGMLGQGLLIAFAEPASGEQTVPIGIAGLEAGDLTSDSTRTSGYVLSTDIAPTILSKFGIPIPDEMDGEPIRAEGSVDPGAVEDLADRMAAIPDRRAPVLIASLAAWIAIAVLVGLLGARRWAAAWLGLAFAYLPLMLLAGAAIEPAAVAEGALLALGAAVLAAITLRLLPGWGALAVACGASAIGYGVDMIAGSGLTRLSLLGPNPIYGVRFYGVGNELEALLAVMVPVGVGAGLSAYSGWGKEVSRRAAIGAFLGAALGGAIVFGAGRLGADVGAAIVLPIGGAIAAATLPKSVVVDSSGHMPEKATSEGRARIVAAIVLTPFIALLLLALIDLISGGNSHLTRSVLDAGGAGDLADVAQRRIELSAHDFAQTAGNPLFWLLIAGLGAAIWRWRRIDAWLRPAPVARAGVIGACAAVAVGVLVNDSGASFLVLGACALGAALAYAWSQTGEIQ
jgi:hypothetical protein